MSIRINQDCCVGCRKCLAVCPGSLIKEADGQIFIKYPQACWGCASCLKECASGAIDFYLGADMGGQGGKMNVRREGDLYYWQITSADGNLKVIEVDRRNANTY